MHNRNDMKLPEGKTCGDCAHYNYCKQLFDCPASNTDCDWAPSRFKGKPIEIAYLLELHRRFHHKAGCPGGDACYVCAAENTL